MYSIKVFKKLIYFKESNNTLQNAVFVIHILSLHTL